MAYIPNNIGTLRLVLPPWTTKLASFFSPGGLHSETLRCVPDHERMVIAADEPA